MGFSEVADGTGRRILLHAGFHRTATKTIQRTFADHRHQLSAQVEVLLKTDLQDVSRAAIAYGERPSATHLETLTDAARRQLGAIDSADPRPLLISSEDLCGAFPHRKGRIGYLLAEDILQAVIAALPAACRPVVFLMTRETNAWMKSCHAHSLRFARGRLTREDYISSHAGPSLQQVAERIATGLPVPVRTANLEETRDRAEGPLAPVLDLLEIPTNLRDMLRDPPHLNQAMPDELLEQFLSLNLTIDDNTTRKRAKRAAFAAWQESLDD